MFLTDKGITEFITDLLVKPSTALDAVRTAFLKSYSAESKGNVFTKVKMDYDSDVALCKYFSKNLERIEGWFNVISPRGATLADMKCNLSVLSAKDWGKVYGTL